MIRNILFPLAAFLLLMPSLCIAKNEADSKNYIPDDYVWTSPSHNSSESMPCGGGDVGMNVWVEDGDVMFYLCRSGSFDENNTLLKAGRVRLQFEPRLFADTANFRQTLHVYDGYVEISNAQASIKLWAEVFQPYIHVEMNAAQKCRITASYESWRFENRPVKKVESDQCSYKWIVPKNTITTKDSVALEHDACVFYHKNTPQTVFDYCIAQQGMDDVKAEMYNPLGSKAFGGTMWSPQMKASGTSVGHYASTPFKAWHLATPAPVKKAQLYIALIDGIPSAKNKSQCRLGTHDKSRKWWHDFWQRSFVDGQQTMARNYTLFRYMLGCNAMGQWPTKFNGGLFTFDPQWVDAKRPFGPDHRRWGGGTATAQNQRLVYWGCLKSGDYDMLLAQLEFYRRILHNAELRSVTYWGHRGACFCEQIENFGLPNPAEYGKKRPAQFDKGVEYNAWLEYEWDTALEFCQMALEGWQHDNAAQIYPNRFDTYRPLVEETLRFFDLHYQYLAQQRGCKALDGSGKLILYPGSACETYKMACNSTTTICGMRRVSQSYLEAFRSLLDSTELAYWTAYVERIPALPIRTDGDDRKLLAPAAWWERVNNSESPQLYPVFPWRMVGMTDTIAPEFQMARNTYLYDADVTKFKSVVSWKQHNIFAACLGLTDEAWSLESQKLANGPYRFPAFWGPGFDWSPDHNWGGSGMIGLQEMLMQCDEKKIVLFPAWPKDQDIHFRLNAPQATVVEATLQAGKVVHLEVTPSERVKDVIVL